MAIGDWNEDELREFIRAEIRRAPTQRDPGLLVGTGSPNGVVTANPGVVYRNVSGGAGTTFYVKESGTGNTGWVGK